MEHKKEQRERKEIDRQKKKVEEKEEERDENEDKQRKKKNNRDPNGIEFPAEMQYRSFLDSGLPCAILPANTDLQRTTVQNRKKHRK